MTRTPKRLTTSMRTTSTMTKTLRISLSWVRSSEICLKCNVGCADALDAEEDNVDNEEDEEDEAEEKVKYSPFFFHFTFYGF